MTENEHQPTDQQSTDQQSTDQQSTDSTEQHFTSTEAPIDQPTEVPSTVASESVSTNSETASSNDNSVADSSSQNINTINQSTTTEDQSTHQPSVQPPSRPESHFGHRHDHDEDSEDEDEDVAHIALIDHPARTGLADPSAALRALEKHTSSRNVSGNNQPVPEPTPTRTRRSRPDVWSCFLGCGQNYRKSSGRSIRRHVISCFREYYPTETADLTDTQLNDLLATRQETGSIDTGLRTWRLRQQRRNAGDLPINERWQCPNGCGRCYRATSVKSIQKHMMNCTGVPSQSVLIARSGGTLTADYTPQMIRAVPANLVPSMVSTSTNNQQIEWHSVQVAQPLGQSINQPMNVSVAQQIPVFPTISTQPFVFRPAVIYQSGIDGFHHLPQIQTINQPINQTTTFVQQTSVPSKDINQPTQQQTATTTSMQQQQFVFPWQTGLTNQQQ